MMFKQVHNLQTDEIERVPLTEAEIQQHNAERLAVEAEAQAKEQQRQAREQRLAQARAKAEANTITPEELANADSVAALRALIAKQQTLIEWLILEINNLGEHPGSTS